MSQDDSQCLGHEVGSRHLFQCTLDPGDPRHTIGVVLHISADLCRFNPGGDGSANDRCCFLNVARTVVDDASCRASQQTSAGEESHCRHFLLGEDRQRHFGGGCSDVADHDENTLGNQRLCRFYCLTGRIGIILGDEHNAPALDTLVADGGLDSSLHPLSEPTGSAFQVHYAADADKPFRDTRLCPSRPTRQDSRRQ